MTTTHTNAAEQKDARVEDAERSEASEIESADLTALTASAIDSDRLDPKTLLHAQRTVGNRATARLVLDRPRPVQRQVQRDDLTQAEKARKAIAEKDVSLAEEVSRNLEGVDAGLKMQLITLIQQNFWVGPENEQAVANLWNSFGDGLAAQVEGAQAQWKLSVENESAEKVHAAKALPEKFQEDVKAVAKSYMESNSKTVDDEIKRLGLEASLQPEAQEDADKRREELREIAREVKRAQEAQGILLATKVGYSGVDSPGGIERHYADPVQFAPGHRPPVDPPPGDELCVPVEHVQGMWNNLENVLVALGRKSPAIFAAINSGSIDVLAEGSDEDAKTKMYELLSEVRENITETKPKIDSGDLDWEDLAPIHVQLWSGMKPGGGSGTDWSKYLNKAVAKEEVAGHEEAETLVNLGIGAVAAIAFVCSEIATAGLATFIWAAAGVGAGALQAGMSWEKWEDLNTAAGAAASDETALVTQEQADAALLAAVLDTIFVAIDAFPLGKAARAAVAAREVSEAGAKAAAKQIGGELTRSASKEVLQNGIQHLGINEVLRKTGMSADELVDALRRQGADAGVLEQAERYSANAREVGRVTGTVGEEASNRLAQGTAREMEGLAGRLANGTLDRAAADALVVQSIAEIGPVATLKKAGGWKSLAAMLTNESEAGRRLYAWRETVWKDIEEHFGHELIQRTGSQGKFSNDLDMSLLGPNASANKERCQAFVHARIGADPGTVLNAGFFVDPRRMHLFDQLPPEIAQAIAARTASVQEGLVWNRRLADALAANDEVLARQIREEMRTYGIREFPFRILSAGDRAVLAAEVDALHLEVVAAKEAGDTARMHRLMEEISNKNALLNASSPGDAYITSGAVRRQVTERDPSDALPGYRGYDVRRPVLTAQDFGNAIGQLGMLDGAAAALKNASSVADISDALKGIGKYGSRLAEGARQTLGEATDVGAAFKALGDEFDDILKQVKAGTAQSELASGVTTIQTRAQTALGQLEALQRTHMAEMRRLAGVHEVAGSAEKLATLTRNNIKAQRAADMAIAELGSLGRLMRTGASVDWPEPGEEVPETPDPHAQRPPTTETPTSTSPVPATVQPVTQRAARPIVQREPERAKPFMLGGIMISDYETAAAVVRLQTVIVKQRADELAGHGLTAPSSCKKVAAAGQALDTKLQGATATDLLTVDDASAVKKFFASAVEAQNGCSAVEAKAAADRAEAAVEAAEEASKTLEQTEAKLRDAQRNAFRADDEEGLLGLGDTIFTVVDTLLVTKDAITKCNDVAHELAAWGNTVVSDSNAVSTGDKVVGVVNAIDALNKGWAAFQLARAGLDLLTGEKGSGQLAHKAVSAMATTVSAGGTLLGASAGFTLYANLYIGPMVSACLKGIKYIENATSSSQRQFLEAGYVHDRSIEWSLQPGGKAMFLYMFAVMNAGSPDAIPAAPADLREYFAEKADLFEAGTKKARGGELPTTGHLWWEEADQNKIHEWVFRNRTNVWAMLYGDIKCPTTLQAGSFT